jgi:hypothetical protein
LLVLKPVVSVIIVPFLVEVQTPPIGKSCKQRLTVPIQ